MLYDSGTLTGGGTIGHIVVNVANVNSLDLRVTDGASGGTNDHADWAGARLVNGLPAAPSNLAAQIASGSQVNLTWTDNSINESAFEILREDPNFSTYNIVGYAPANATSFIDPQLLNGETYSYEVLASNTVGNSAISNLATVSVPAVPTPPTNLHLTQLTIHHRRPGLEPFSERQSNRDPHLSPRHNDESLCLDRDFASQCHVVYRHRLDPRHAPCLRRQCL